MRHACPNSVRTDFTIATVVSSLAPERTPLPPADPVAVSPTDLARLHVALLERVVAAANPEAAIRGLLEVSRELTNAIATAYFVEPPGAQAVPWAVDGAPDFDSKSVFNDPRFLPPLRQAFEQRAVQIAPIESLRGAIAVIVPVSHVDGTTPEGEQPRSDGAASQVLVALLVVEGEPLEPFVVVLQLLAGYLTLAGQRSLTARYQWEAVNASAILELVRRILDAEDAHHAAFTIADGVQRHLDVKEVAVGRERRGKVRLESLSGHSELTPGSELGGEFARVLGEALIKDDETSWSADSPRPTTEPHRRLCESRRAAFIHSGPLVAEGDASRWAWVILADRPLGESELRWLTAAAPLLATALAAVTAASRGRGLVGGTRIGRKLWVVAAIGLIGLFVPVPFHVRGDSVVQPMTRRFVSAPFDATLMSSAVRPGDLVAADQPLARLDDRDLRSQLTEAIAQQSSAETKAKASLANKDVTESQLGRIEAERLGLRIDLYRRRLDEIEIKAPIAGVVLAGDWDQAIGAPLRVGQTLFEVAPLGQMRIEVDIAAEDAAWVTEGSEAALWFDAVGRSDVATVSRLRPRSEVRDGRNVFVAEVELYNTDDSLRPGMRGSARVRSGTRPLGWVLLRKPWYFIRDLLWW